MTENNSLKKLVRARMAILGENYTLAKANLYRGVPQRLNCLFEAKDFQRLQTVLPQGGSGMILVTGRTGHGKTSTVASLLYEYEDLVDKQFPRAVIIEEAFELKTLVELAAGEPLPYLVSWSPSEIIPLAELIDASRIMRANVLAVGEIRSGESLLPMALAVERGHDCISSLHSSSLRQTLHRLKILSEGADAHERLVSSLAAVVEQERIIVGKRSVLLTAVVPVTEELRALAASNASEEQYETHLLSLGIESLNAKLKRLEKSGAIELIEGRFRFSK